MNKNFWLILTFTAFFTLIDQFSKAVAMKFLPYSTNEGVAFGIPVPYTALIIVNVLLIFLIIYLSCRELDYDKYLARLSVSLLLAGGAGNLIDRLKNGYVIDFIEIWKWPSFNVADIFISVGVLLIIFFYAKIKQVKT